MSTLVDKLSKLIAEQAAAAAAEKLRSAWTQITDGLMAEVARIRGSMAAFEPRGDPR